MFKKLSLTLFLIFVLTYFGCTQGEKNIYLQYKYKPGTTLIYKQISKRTTKVIEADSVIEQYSTSYSINIEQAIKRFENNIAEIIETSEWSHEIKNKEDSTKIDTKISTNEMVFRVKPNGKIVDIEFLPEKSNSYRNYIKNYFEQGMPLFPESEVSPGYSWTQTSKVVLPDETLDATTTYTIKSIVREAGYDCAVIEFNGNLLIPVEMSKEKGKMRSGMDRIQATGMIYFAFKEGMIVLQRERWVIDGIRNVVEEDKTRTYKIAVEADSDFSLKKVVID